MLVERDLDHLGSSVVNQSGALFIVGILQQLLAQIVAKWI